MAASHVFYYVHKVNPSILSDVLSYILHAICSD